MTLKLQTISKWLPNNSTSVDQTFKFNISKPEAIMYCLYTFLLHSILHPEMYTMYVVDYIIIHKHFLFLL